ncbi:hypothetical protein HGT71_09195 [Rosenbergiella epipactidis]|uniref:sugar dehydrogenase complex small subunit n=1 Tax=Rosenbergiella epipactidis TaxID=1544694 RepID=UPI001BD93815|nr:sugar dehydrogenase complex small subunit [Rosenbergiella epipactidis]MBT0718433.1 hypothetical protein [Rosenbergiella epipactidis]
MNRRYFLQLMVGTSAIALFPLQSVNANTVSSSYVEQLLKTSELLTGRRGLPIAVADRLSTLLIKHDAQFPQQLARLFTHLNTLSDSDRQNLVGKLDDQDVKTALAIISPWYLGFTGHPSTTQATDDAEFVTFLSALMYEPTHDITIRPSYARAGSDYWAEVPDGVIAPDMPDNIREWGEMAPKPASSIPAPRAPWLLMVQGKAKTLTEAEALLAAQ